MATKPTERVKLTSVEVARLSTLARSRGVLKVRPAAAFQLPSMFSGRVNRRPVTSSWTVSCERLPVAKLKSACAMRPWRRSAL